MKIKNRKLCSTLIKGLDATGWAQSETRSSSQSGQYYADSYIYPQGVYNKNKNTLKIYPFIERDFIVIFNCTDEPLIIKSLSPSKFNEERLNQIKIIDVLTQINKSLNNESANVGIIKNYTKKSSELSENLTNWTKKQNQQELIKDCKDIIRFPIVVVSFLIGIGVLSNFIKKFSWDILKGIELLGLW